MVAWVCCIIYILIFFLAALPVVEKALERAENIHFVHVGVGDRDL
jgi:hypothetical protein